MKILQLGKAYPPANLGGIEITIQLITEGLHSQGINCDVLGVNDKAESVIENKEYGVIYREALITKAFSTLFSLRLITRLFKIHTNYNIIHIHHPDPMSALALWLVKPKCKIVLHWHSDILRQKFLLKLYKPIQKWLLETADAIITTSSTYALSSNDLKAHLKKVSTIPIGINKESLVYDEAMVHNIKAKHSNNKILLAIGRMSYYKGYEYMIESMKYTHPDCILFIIGGGELIIQFKQKVADAGLINKVIFLGKVSNLEKNSYIAACDIFVLSSIFKTEAFAIVQLEAMALGKPIVSTEIPGSGVQWVNKNNVSGLTVPIKDPMAIAQAVNKLILDDEFYMLLSKNGKSRFTAEFSQKKMTDRIIHLYEIIIS